MSNIQNAVDIINTVAVPVTMISVAGVAGWVITTWMKIKNGYPLEGMWGQSLHPKTSSAEMERIKLLSQENAQLQAEIGSLKDRLANVERIVTDDSHRLVQDIEALRITAKN